MPIFGKSKGRIDDLNKAAPHFFGMAQDMWWRPDTHAMELTGKDTRTLSILRLPDLAPVSRRAELKPKIKNAVATASSRTCQRLNTAALRPSMASPKPSTDNYGS